MKRLVLSAFFILVLARASYPFLLPIDSGVEERQGVPLFLHTGIPYDPGKMNIRFTTFHSQLDGVPTDGTGIHIEIGVMDRLGLHIRNDHIQDGTTEIMLQMALLLSDDRKEGLSFILENAVSAPSNEANSVFMTGFTATKMIWADPMNFSLQFDLKNNGVEFESSYAHYLTPDIDLILEVHSDSMSAGTFTNVSYDEVGVRYKLAQSLSVAIATRAPLSADRDFDTSTELQTSLTL